MTKSRGETPLREFGVAVVLDPESRLLVRRRPGEGLLGGLWEFPNVCIRPGEDPAKAARRAAAEAGAHHLEPASSKASGTLQPVRHTFSHFRANYRPFTFSAVAASLSEGCRWIDPPEASALAWPVAQRKILTNWRSAAREKILA